MDPKSTPTAGPSPIDDLFTLTLVDGLPVLRGGQQLRYRTVRLRETTVADEQMALRQAERLAVVAGVHKMVVSDQAFAHALNVRHIDAFELEGERIAQPVVDVELVGKLSSHDMHLIEQRILLITLAAEVRYGNMTQEAFNAILAGERPSGTAQSPQPQGQTAGVGEHALRPESGPEMLADFAGAAADGAAARHA